VVRNGGPEPLHFLAFFVTEVETWAKCYKNKSF